MGTHIIPAHGTQALQFALRAVFAMWPNALIEDADSGAIWGRFTDIPIAGRTDLRCWRDDNAAMQREPAPGTLIRLSLSDAGLTVSIDANPHPQIRTFAEDLRIALLRNRIADGTVAG